MRLLIGVAATFGLILAGCRKQGPIELDDQQPSPLEIVQSPPASITAIFGAADIDPANLFPIIQQRSYGQLIVAGSEFDSFSVHHEGSLARAIFFDPDAPIVLDGGDTAGYRTLDAGSIEIDNVPLVKHEKRIVVAAAGVDTIVGVQYSLVDRDGIGGRGFQFAGGHSYHWTGTGSTTIHQISADEISPSPVHIESPLPGDPIVLSRNLRIRWEGGGDSVLIRISAYQSGGQIRTLLQLRQTVNAGGLTIPSVLLRILRDQSRALVTVSSESVSGLRVDGYRENIVVKAVTAHHLLLPVTR